MLPLVPLFTAVFNDDGAIVHAASSSLVLMTNHVYVLFKTGRGGIILSLSSKEFING